MSYPIMQYARIELSRILNEPQIRMFYISFLTCFIGFLHKSTELFSSVELLLIHTVYIVYKYLGNAIFTLFFKSFETLD